jgi:hypothetical protein
MKKIPPPEADDQLENDPAFLRRTAKSRASLREGKGVKLEELDAERLRREAAAAELTRLAREASHSQSGPEPSEEKIVAAVERTRRELYRGG